MNGTKEEIVKAIYNTVDSLQRIDGQRLRQWGDFLSRAPSDVLFDALYSIFLDESRPATKYLDQEYAGKLLWLVKPHCQRPPQEVIRKALKNYELSIEELPWYIAETFGSQEVMTLLTEMDRSSLSESERKGLETFVYWLRVPEDQRKKG